ncbi:methyl-accepting chemotaxis sensory transducer [Gracilibacillus halophilus YIM-C55.5]|uniref:Methyl-accepting chemotaxis sensory transducer n=1 Tax=Gracilibacillus halophilus YIM-C55.5 TaxID=1308866 RepID=N4WQ52_9BACI|nr:methyl-accepting chemotaxis protein [Gracilibacillus halophilus]ENH96570.1 methyl-accepting chemotaxis sensory transducer [Gracilibacillus halophilus YIM-C55.5]
MSQQHKLKFWNRLQFRIVVVLAIVLLCNSAISNFIIQLIEWTKLDLGQIGIWINNFMNIIVGTALISLLVRYLVIKPIHKMEKKIEEFENGDLEARMDIKGQNEITNFGARLNHLLDQMVHYRKQQHDQIALVEGKTESIFKKFDAITQGLHQLKEYHENITAYSQQNVSSFEETNSVTDNMNKNFQSIAQELKDVTDSFQHMQHGAEKGMERIEGASNMMTEIADRANDTKDSIRGLTDEIKNIQDIVTLINDISEQTNLLALNASIEAARAGEHGKGFSIVADEVRKLAERSVEATDQITNTVNKILSDADAIANQSESRANNINEESGKILELNENFKSLLDNIVTNIEHTEKINQETQTLTESIDEITTTTEELTSNAEKTNEYIVDMNDSLTKRLNDLEDVQKDVHSLRESFTK